MPEPRFGFAEEDEYGWERPEPLPNSVAPLPLKPDVLGDLGAYARAVATETGTPVDLAILAQLGTCSALIAGSVVVEPTEGWREPANLYLVGLAAPGEGKTPALGRYLSVLDEIEADRRDRQMPEIVAARERKAIAEARKREFRAKAAKAQGDDRSEADNEAIEAAQEFENILVPPAPRIYCREATPEALAKLLGEHSGRMAVVTDEGAEFFELASRYSATGKGNFGIYLAGHDGARYVSDRVGSDTITIENTTLSVCMFAQPVILESLAKDRQMVGRGLLARISWVMPSSLVGTRSVYRESVPHHLAALYEERMTILAAEAEKVVGDPLVLRLEDNATRVFFAWWEQHEPRLKSITGDLSGFVEWASKLPGQLLRIASNLNAIRTGTIHGTITEETMRAAISVVETLIDHARYVFGAMKADRVLSDAIAVYRWLETRNLSEVTERDIYRSKDWEPLRTKNAVHVLAEYGWVRPKTSDLGEPGRPSSLWEIHPGVPANTRQNRPGVDVLAGFDREIPRTPMVGYEDPPPDDSLFLDEDYDDADPFNPAPIPALR